MSKKIEMIDKRFGRLIVKSEAHHDNGVYWNCICDCGRSCIAKGNALRSGDKISCGCALQECKEKFIEDHFKHGLTKHELFPVWQDMMRRCYDTKRKNDYRNYGARGITVNKRWQENFNNFLEDMGERPEGLTLERRNNEMGYSKENCYWASRAEQNRNSRFSKRWYIEGITFNSATLAAEYFGVCHVTIINWCKSKLKADCYSELKYGGEKCR